MTIRIVFGAITLCLWSKQHGQLQYLLHRHALMCVVPGQIGGKTDMGEEIHTKGWTLLFDTELLRNTELGRRMAYR